MLVCILLTFQLKPSVVSFEEPKTNWLPQVSVKPHKVVNDEIICALLHIESNGDDSAKGDKTKTGYYRAIGAMQLHKCYVDEANDILESEGQGRPFSYDDRWDRKKSIMIAKVYLTYFCEKYNRWDYEFIARCHNGGGYGGWKNPNTIKYVEKVEKHLAVKDLSMHSVN